MDNKDFQGLEEGESVEAYNATKTLTSSNNEGRTASKKPKITNVSLSC